MSRIYGTPLFISGGGGNNETLPPLLDNFAASKDGGTITITANKLESGRAEHLAGAVWVYGEHEPKNVNDGTRLQLTREELVFSATKTRASGKTVGDLESKSKVKLGRYAGTELQWLVCRNAEKKLFLILAAESMGVLGNKMFDNVEPNNSDSNRRIRGNNRYIWSNIRQWINSSSPANSWYSSQHSADAPPNYTNVAGFLHEWTEKEIGVLENASWVVTKHSVDGGGTESFQNRIVLPSTTEMGLESNTGGARIDIFNNNEDRVVAGGYWCRTPYPSGSDNVRIVASSGTLSNSFASYTGFGVRPICSIPETIPISDSPDSDGCYTLVFTPPLERTVVWDKSKNFYARQFTYNSKKQYQTMLEGAVASVIVEGAPANVTDFQITGSGASLVLSWVNPIDDELYQETVVIQKQGSEPTDITDGTEIYRGTDETCTATGLEQSTDYYFAIYTVSSLGVYKQPVVKSYRFDFPDKPSDDDYTEISTVTTSGTFVVPENGWFKVVVTGKGFDGGTDTSPSECDYRVTAMSVRSGSGGKAGGAAVSIFQFNKGEEIPYTIAGNKATFKEMSCSGATASGGNLENHTGNNGTYGISQYINARTSKQSVSVRGGNGGTGPSKYNPYGGTGAGIYAAYDSDDVTFDSVCPTSPGKAQQNFIKFFRGNTNIPSPSQASALSLIPKNNSVEATWKNSGDPVQTGTMLVYNTSHTPKSPSDGVAIDVPLTQPVTLALNSNSKELQEDSKKQSYTITGVPNDKPVFVALFPYDKDRKYGLAKQEVEIPREHSWYDKQQELESEVETVKAEMAD